jgi:RES domain
MRLPPVRPVDARDTHRLIPSRYSPTGESVLVRIAHDDADLAAIFELDSATNDRLAAEGGLLPGIGPDELVAGVPLASVINAAFCHAHPYGSRFSGPLRGAWYAGLELETAQAEVAFHKAVELAEIGWPDESVTYDEYLADVSGELHDVRHTRGFAACLSLTSYAASQALGQALLDAGALALLYPSVRRTGGTSLVCFRPALVARVRRGTTWRFIWRDGQGPVIEPERPSLRATRRRRE